MDYASVFLVTFLFSEMVVHDGGNKRWLVVELGLCRRSSVFGGGVTSGERRIKWEFSRNCGVSIKQLKKKRGFLFQAGYESKT